MKEAFWGVLIVLLGLFGVVVINIFQNVTVDNDRVYYLIKESTEASAYDALDLTYYRLSGNLRIVEDKFVENLTRRFAENVTIGNYTIIVEDVNEMPPKVSLRVRSGITSLIPGHDEFNIVNRVDGILETKYSLKEVIEFLEISEDEWKKAAEIETGNICKPVIDEDIDECIFGDLMFIGFDDVTISEGLCTEPRETIDRKVNYKVCNCDGWEEKSEMVSAKRVASGNEYVYTWKFTKTGDIRTISESITERVLKPVCTIGIAEMVPEGIEEVKPKEDGTSYEPSSDNSKYKLCPAGGIRIPVGMKFTMHPEYTPANSINRYLDWTVTDDNILGIAYNKSENPINNPINDCVLNNKSTNCLSKSIVTAKNVGISYINVKTTQGQTATCKIEVFDGNVDSVGCKDITINPTEISKIVTTYEPINATKIDFKYKVNDSTYLDIDETTGVITGKNDTYSNKSTTVTVIAPNGKKGSCTVTIKGRPSQPSTGGQEDGCGCSCKDNICGKSSSNKYNLYEYYWEPKCKWRVNDYGSWWDGCCRERVKERNSVSCGYDPNKTNKPGSGGGSGGGNGGGHGGRPGNGACFKGDTKVVTSVGYKNIADINVGDKVLSYNEVKKINEYKTVTKVYIHKNTADVLYFLSINNKVLSATRLHRFYVKTDNGYDWISAEDLNVGDLVMDSSGMYYKISKINSKTVIDDFYNLEVEDNHNYYVTKEEILVHNAKTIVLPY